MKKYPTVSDTENPDIPDTVTLPVEDSLDLHAFAPQDIPGVVEEYLFQCRRVGMREVRIIHGKGTGVQRRIVRSVLSKDPCVASFRDAPPEAGGWGAVTVVLKRPGRTSGQKEGL